MRRFWAISMGQIGCEDEIRPLAVYFNTRYAACAAYDIHLSSRFAEGFDNQPRSPLAARSLTCGFTRHATAAWPRRRGFGLGAGRWADAAWRDVTKLAKLRLTKHRVYEKTGTIALEYAAENRASRPLR